jgi:ribokinase
LPASNYNEYDIKNAVKELFSNIGIYVDLHTRIGAGWSNGNETVFVPAFNVQARTLTGAGDSWDSANIIGHLSKEISVIERLTFSNAFASLYVKNTMVNHLQCKKH